MIIKRWITGKTETRKNVFESYLYSRNVFFSGLSFVVSATFTLALAVEREFHHNGSLLVWMLVGIVSILSLFSGTR